MICELPRGSLHFNGEKWSLHSFLTTASQQADVASNILLFFYKKKWKQNKKIIKYYQPYQLVVELLWEMSVGIISLKKNIGYISIVVQLFVV
jgi:hypothetical protein